MKQVGSFSKEIIRLLSLNIEEGTAIYIGDDNERHVMQKHPYEYEFFYDRVEEILASPDYVGKNKKHNSIDFIKVFSFGDDYVQASVRVDTSGKHIVRTIYQVMSYKMERYIASGTVIKVP